MEEIKMRKLMGASVAAGIIILFVLLVVMVYQIISIGSKKREIDKLKTEIATLEEEMDEMNDEIDLWLQEWKIEERARQIGMINKDDKGAQTESSES